MRLIASGAAAALLLLAAARPAAAQDEEKRTVSGLPSRYADCLRGETVDVLLTSPATQWGLSEELAQNAHERLYGIQLCRSFTQDAPQPCRRLGEVKGFGDKKMTAQLGRDCASDADLFLLHAALHAENRPSVETRCLRWCEREAGKGAKQMDCAAFCKQVLPLMPGHAEQACRAWVEKTAAFNRDDPDYAREETAGCLMRLDPTPATCTDVFGPYEKRACRDRAAVLDALRQKDAKRCPKGPRYAGLCAALTGPPPKPADDPCAAAVKAFTKPFCDARRESGGLQDNTKLPGDAESEEGW